MLLSQSSPTNCRQTDFLTPFLSYNSLQKRHSVTAYFKRCNAARGKCSRGPQLTELHELTTLQPPVQRTSYTTVTIRPWLCRSTPPPTSAPWWRRPTTLRRSSRPRRASWTPCWAACRTTWTGRGSTRPSRAPAPPAASPSSDRWALQPAHCRTGGPCDQPIAEQVDPATSLSSDR